MTPTITVRPILESDRAAWTPLWEGYNAFYGRSGSTALAAEVTEATWRRFFDPAEPVHALVAEGRGRLLGLAHFLFHRSTTRLELSCYLHDLFTDPNARSLGIGRALIHGVYEQARSQGTHRVYWHTQASNATARALYDKLAAHTGFLVYTHEV